jgi:hypothetical protein
MQWAEDLPEDCPPQGAIVPNGEVFYRIVKTIPPDESDFYSTKKLGVKRRGAVDECVEMALSIFSTLDDCKSLKAIESFKNRLIVSFTLDKGCGLIKSTPSKAFISHYSWWLAAGFNPIPLCSEAGRVS